MHTQRTMAFISAFGGSTNRLWLHAHTAILSLDVAFVLAYSEISSH